MTFITPGPQVRGHVRVTIRKPHRGGIRGIAFSSALIRKMFGEATHVAVNRDEKTRVLTFFPSGPIFRGQYPTHKLMPDGGGGTLGRCVFFNPKAAELIEHVPSGRYDVEVLADRFKIRWQKKDELPRAVQSRRKS